MRVKCETGGYDLFRRKDRQMSRRLASFAAFILASAMFPGMVQAQTGTTSPYRVDYFDNANTTGAPDATLRLSNTGAAGHTNLCADIFVFAADEEISECCSCLETPNGLRKLSVNNNLTSSPFAGIYLTEGTIVIVAAATTGGACPVPVHITSAPNAEIQAWATHIQDGFIMTEAPSEVSALSSTEEKALADQCGAIIATTEAPICSCGTGS